MYFPEQQEYKISNKSEEELKRLTLDENMTEIQRAYHILTKGQQIQKKAIYSSLAKILPKGFDQLFKVVMQYQFNNNQKNREEVLQQDEDNQIVAGKQFQKLLKEQQLKDHQLQQIYELSVQILKIWSQPVLEEWCDTMDLVLRKIELKPHITQLILLLTDSSQPTISRQTACRLIATMAELKAIKGPLLDRARLLCSDHETEIRLSMAKDVMLKICRVIDQESLETYLLEKVLELYYDSDLSVKQYGMQLFYDIAQYLSSDEIKTRVVKLFIDQIQSQIEESKLVMSKVCGNIYNLIHSYLERNIQNILLFLSIYKDYSKSKSLEIRLNFAFNFPAILSLSQKRFEFFQDAYLIVAFDTNEEVIRCLISSFHEIVLLSESSEQLLNIFQQWMKHKSLNVLEVLILRFSQIVAAFQNHQQAQLCQSSMDLMLFLITKNSWELLQNFLIQLQTSHQIISDHDIFMNAMLNCLNKGSKLIRRLCIQNLAIYIVETTNLKKRNETYRLLYDLLFKSESYFNRLAYVDLVDSLIDKLSRRLFKQFGLFCVLDYGCDKIVDVRIKLIQLLPKLKLKIDPIDESVIEQFEQSVCECAKQCPKSFQQIIQFTKEQLLQVVDQEEIDNIDIELLQNEELVHQSDQKQRQLELDEDNDNNISDFLTRYKRKQFLSSRNQKIKFVVQSQTQIKKEVKSFNQIMKKSVDLDGQRSPVFDKKILPKQKASTMVKSLQETRKVTSGFKLPALKK